MDPRLNDVLDLMVPRAISNLLETYCPEAATTNPGGSVPKFVATTDICGALLPFFGLACNGSILLTAPFDFFAASYPSELRGRPLSAASPGDWILVRDWSGEMCNQLLGRVKNTLLPYGVTLTSKVPLALMGEPLTHAARGRTAHEVVRLSGPHVVRVWLDIVTAPDFIFQDRDSQAPTVKEGEIIVF